MGSLSFLLLLDFIDFVLVKLWDPLSNLFKELQPCYQNLIANRKMYESQYRNGKSYFPSRSAPQGDGPRKHISITFRNLEPLGLELSAKGGKQGAFVKEVIPGTHAEKAGLGRGYVVSRIGERFVEHDTLETVADSIRNGKRPLVVVFRPGSELVSSQSSTRVLPPISSSPGSTHSPDMEQIFSNAFRSRTSKYVLIHNVNRARKKLLGYAQKSGEPAKIN